MVQPSRTPPRFSPPGETGRRWTAGTLATLLLTLTHLPGVVVLAAPQVFARVGPGVSNLPLSVAAFDDPNFGEISDAVNVATGNAYVDLGQVNRNNTNTTALTNSGATLGGATSSNTSLSGGFNVNGVLRLNGFNTNNPAQPQEWSLALGDGGYQVFQRVTRPGTTARCVDNRSEVFGIAKQNTGTGRTELHVLKGSDNFQSFMNQTGTAFEYGPAHVYRLADWDNDGIPDLIRIKRYTTGTGKTEVHIASGASNYQDLILQTGTILGQTDSNWDFNVADWNGDGKLDLIGTPYRTSGTNSVEVHVMNGADNFQSFLYQSGTAMPLQPATTSLHFGDWDGDGRPDLISVNRAQTGTGKTEVHILSGTGGFTRSLLDVGTVLGTTGDNWEFSVIDWDKDGKLDVVAVLKNGTGTRKTEVHVLNGATNFQTFVMQTGTALGEVTNDDWTFTSADYPASCTAAAYDLTQAPSWIGERYAGLASVAYYVTKPQAGVQTDEEWLVTYRLPNGRMIAHYYDHDGTRTTFYGDGEYADYTQNPYQQYRGAKYQSDTEGLAEGSPKTQFTYTQPGNGHLRRVRDEWGRVTSYQWDESMGAVVAVNMLLQTDSDDSWMRRIEYAYEVVGNQRVVTFMAFRTYDGRGNRVGRWFDLSYRLGTNNEVLLGTLIRPVLAGNVEGTLGLGGGETTTYTYDAQNRLVRTSTLGEPDTTFSYGQSTAETGAGGPRVTQQQGDRVTVYEFSPEGWLRNRSVRNFNPVTGTDNDPRSSVWNGWNTTTWYDEGGRILAQTLPAGVQRQYTYDQHGNRKTEAIYRGGVNWAPTPPDGYERLTQYSYDNDNRLTREAQVARSGQGWSRDTTAADAPYTYGSVEKRYEYVQHDPFQGTWGNVTAVRTVAEKLYLAGVMKRQFHTGIDVYGRTTNTVLFVNDTPYKTVDYTYYTEGAVVGLVYPSSMTTPYSDGRTYDRDKTVRQYADQVAAKVSNGVRTEYLYDEYGNVAREFLPNSHIYAWENGVAKTAQRHHWHMYNGFGQPVWESLWEYQPEKDSWPQMISRQWAYYASGELDASWDGTPAKVTDYRYYDSGANLGRLAAKVTGIGSNDGYGVVTPHETVAFGYDGYGRPNTTSVDGFTTTLTYDSLDRVVKTVNPDGSYRWVTYRPFGDVGQEVVKNVGSAETTTWHEADSLGRETYVLYPNGGVRTYYDAFDRPVKITDNRLTMNANETDRSTYLVYDTAGNLIKKLDPALVTAAGQPYSDARRPYTEYGYDQLDRRTVQGRLLYGATITPSAMTFPNGAVVAWTNTAYDVFDRPTQIKDAEGYATDFAYDNSDNTITVSRRAWKGTETDRSVVHSGFDVVTSQMAYDASARPVQQVDARGNSKRTTYTYFGPTSQVDERNIVTKVYTYTKDGLLEGVWEPDNNPSTTAQHGSVNVLSPSGTHVRTEYREYDSRSYPARVYTAHMTTSAGPNSGALTSYTYDDQGNPTRTVLPPDQNGATATIEQTYDNLGNVLSTKDALGFPTVFTYDWAGRLVGKHEQARSGNQTDIDAGLQNGLRSEYRYDAAGNLTYKEERGLITEYRYNSLGKVTHESRPRVGAGTGTYWKLRTYRLDSLMTAETTYDYTGNLTSRPNVVAFGDASVTVNSGNLTVTEYNGRGDVGGRGSFAPGRVNEYSMWQYVDGLGNRYKRVFQGNMGIYAEQRTASGEKLGHASVISYWKFDSNSNLAYKWDTPAAGRDGWSPRDPSDQQNVFSYSYTPTNKEWGSSRNIAVRVRGAMDPRFTELTIQGGSTGLLITGSRANSTATYNERDQLLQYVGQEESPTPSPAAESCTGTASIKCRGVSLPNRHYNFGTRVERTTNYLYYLSGQRSSAEVVGVGQRRVDAYDQRGREISVYDSNGPAKAGAGIVAAKVATTVNTNYNASGQQQVTYSQGGQVKKTENRWVTLGDLMASADTTSYHYHPTLGLVDKVTYSASTWSVIGYDPYGNESTVSTTQPDESGPQTATTTRSYNLNGAQVDDKVGGTVTDSYELDSRGNRLKLTSTNSNVTGFIKRYDPDDRVATYYRLGVAGFCGGVFGNCSTQGVANRYNDFRYDPYGQQVVTGTSDIAEGGNNEYKIHRIVRSTLYVEGEAQYIFGRGGETTDSTLFFHWANDSNGEFDQYTPTGYLIKDQTYSAADGLMDTTAWEGTKVFTVNLGAIEALDAPVKPLSSVLNINPLDVGTGTLPNLPDPAKISNGGVQQKGKLQVGAPPASQKEAVQPPPSNRANENESTTTQTLAIDMSGGGGVPAKSVNGAAIKSQQASDQQTGKLEQDADKMAADIKKKVDGTVFKDGQENDVTAKVRKSVNDVLAFAKDQMTPSERVALYVGLSEQLSKDNAGTISFKNAKGEVYKIMPLINGDTSNVLINLGRGIKQLNGTVEGREMLKEGMLAFAAAAYAERQYKNAQASAFLAILTAPTVGDVKLMYGALSAGGRGLRGLLGFGKPAAAAGRARTAYETGVEVLEGIIKGCATNSFSPNTPVRILSGLVAISALSVGTPVLAYNEQTGENGYYPITAVHKNLDPDVTYLSVSDPEQGGKLEYIQTTPEHPFYVREWSDGGNRPKPVGHEDLGKNWVGAGHLKVGDKIKQADGTTGVVANVVTLQQTREMFNLTVSEAHTYYVGQDGWLVHNQNNPYTNKSKLELERAKKSFEKLITEHEQKLAEFSADPMKFDDGRMANASPEVRQKMINGRIGALEKQLQKQRGELAKILESLGGC